ncbi:MAG: hypothetical protein O2856_04420 [Planctomycetota bacterium]|nr:hypothetical protein [Planctomycetota bacterium]
MQKAHTRQPRNDRQMFLREYDWIVRASHAESHDPEPMENLIIGVEGALTNESFKDDFRVAECYRASHVVALQPGKHYQVDLGGDFDTLLRIEDDRYKSLLFNDDIWGGPERVSNSRIVFSPDREAAYRLVVSSNVSRATGNYRLSMKEVVPAGSPITLHDTLTVSDLNSNGNYYKRHTVELQTDLSTRIVLQSQSFDTFVELRNADGETSFGWNATMTHDNPRLSRLDMTPAYSGMFRIYVSSPKTNVLGSYDVTAQQFRHIANTWNKIDDSQ